MSEVSDERSLAGNPFSPFAVARITDVEPDEVTIETDAIRQATAYVSAYLTSASAPGDDVAHAGNVIAIVGDYGTGKSHLAMRLVRYARHFSGDLAQSMYLDATADKFFSLYHRFVLELGLEGVRTRVSEYYADIVADSLRTSGLTAEAVQGLRERDVEPRHVVEGLGLMESALLRRVQQELKDVTKNTSFGTALTLLLRPGFDKAVWTWLTGGQPSQILVERGINESIRSEVASLEAMGVVALLYAGKRRRFLLVIDELDKVLSATNRPQADVMAAFQKLLQVFVAAGAFLVLSGLPDFLQVLPSGVRQRIGRIVTMSGLGTDEVCRFIEQTQEREFGEQRLRPFTRDSVGYLVRLAGGNARQVMRLCHHLYRKATDQRTLVTDEMVREIAREQFSLASAEDVSATIRRLLDSNGWSYYRNHFLDAVRDSRVDFWVTFGVGNAGCAVLLTGSVLDPSDVDRLTRRAWAVRGASPGGEVLLVVNGVLPDELAAQLREPFSSEPLVYDSRSFAEDFTAILGAIAQRLHRVADSDPLTVVREQVEQINRQQSSIYSFLEQLATHLDGARSSSDRQLAAIRRDLGQLSNAVHGAGPAGTKGAADAPSPIPAEVDRLFRDALNVLEELAQLDVPLGEVFAGTGDTSHAYETRDAMQLLLRSPEFLEATGVAVLLQNTVLAFRDAVGDWYRADVVDAHGGRLSDAAKDRLDLLCRTYDAISEYLPLFRLESLTQPASWSRSGDDMVAEVSRPTRRSTLRTTFDNLSVRVRRAVLRSVAASGA